MLSKGMMKGLVVRRLAVFGVLCSLGVGDVVAEGKAGGYVVSSGDSFRGNQHAEVGLEQALKATMRLHPAIQGQRAALNAAHYGEDSANAARMPVLTVQGDTLDEEASGSAVFNQPLWSFGRIDSSVYLARSDIRQEQLRLLEIQRDLSQQTAQAYAEVESAHELIQVALSDVDEHQHLYDRIKRRSGGGLASEADVHFAYGRLVQAQARLVGFQRELAVAETRLLALTQQPVDSHHAVPENLFPWRRHAELKQQALNASPSLALKSEEVIAAGLRTEQQLAEHFPTLSFQVERTIPNGAETDGDPLTRSGFVLEARFGGSSFGSYANTRRARAEQRAAELDERATRLEVARQIDALLINRDMQQRLLEAQINTVKAVGNTLDSFFRQYETGRKTWIEVLNTQREYTEARVEQQRIRANWLDVVLQLSTQTGGLDVVAGIPVEALIPIEPNPTGPGMYENNENNQVDVE